MTAHAAFYKHPNGRVVQVHTAAEATTYQRRGYTVTTWDVWYTYYLTTIAQPINTVIIERDLLHKVMCWLDAERDDEDDADNLANLEDMVAKLCDVLEGQE
jgi:hypothetical protein